MQIVLLDTNIVLDYLDSHRPRHKSVKTFLKNCKNKVKFLLSSYQYDTILFLLKRFLKISKKEIISNFKKFLLDFNVNIISITGFDAKQSIDYSDPEDGILISICERIGKDCIILTYDENLIKCFERAITPEKFKISENSSISLLDLKQEYLYYAEDLENALLKTAVNAEYILGPEVSELEQKIASYIGTKHAIGVSSGTDALVISLRALAIKIKGQEYWDKEDLIITTPFTFTATGDAILRAGATPLFVDIDLDTFNIDPEQIKKALKKYRKRVVGILPVHLYGQPCDMGRIMELAKDAGIFVVEDCAQSFGAKWDGRKTGSFGDIGCFSFFPSKNLGGFGDGGMVTTDDDELAEVIRMLRKHGGKDKYNVDHIGYNARLDTLQAAILLAKMKYIDEFNKRRREIASFYDKYLKEIAWIKTPKVQEKAYHVYHQYTIRVLNKRDEVQKKLKEKGIQTMVYYPVSLHQMKVFKNRCECLGELKNATEATKQVLSLPIEPMYGEEICRKVVEGVRSLG